jgi:hypothetical protein
VILLVPFYVSAAVPNPVLKVDRFAIAGGLGRLRRRGIGSILGYMSSYDKEF